VNNHTDQPARTSPLPRATAPRKQGLYDPAFEHDACGVGFVADIHGRPSRKIVTQGLRVLDNLDHRGATGAEQNTGDGAGILVQIPHAFLLRAAQTAGIALPERGAYGTGLVFLPRDPASRQRAEQHIAAIVRDEGQTLLGWRDVPTDNSDLGATARACEPVIRQIFIERSPALAANADPLAFERKLYVIRKRASRELAADALADADLLYLASLSARTLVYKGMLRTAQVPKYFRDLNEPDFASAIALVHSRFSTNTFPSWSRSHPYRYLAHNGEINTLRGNVNWMHARQQHLATEAFGDDIKKILPVINPNGSDSAMFDNTLELLHLAGRSLPHAILMMVPEPWSNHKSMDPNIRAFYEYNACLTEPWDGPAALAFTDGTQIGAWLDRNGLRPARYYITTDGLVVLASEAGVLDDIPPASIAQKGRLQPGKMFLVDTAQGRVVQDDEIKRQLAAKHPYAQWLEQNRLHLDARPPRRPPPPPPPPRNVTFRIYEIDEEFGEKYEHAVEVIEV
jgi:glutamate synthase (ferredoxin)